jgi:hypothetical protein
MDDYNLLINLALAASIGLYLLVAYILTSLRISRCINELEELDFSVSAEQIYVTSNPFLFDTKIVTIYPGKVVVSSSYRRWFTHNEFDTDSTKEINIWKGYLEIVPKDKISKSSDMISRFEGSSEFGLHCMRLGSKPDILNWIWNGRHTTKLFKEKLVAAGFNVTEHKPVRRSGFYKVLGAVAVLLLVFVFLMLIFSQQ